MTTLFGALILGGLVSALTGCALSGPAVTSPTAGLACVDDSSDCIRKRQRTLQYLLNEPDNTWIRQAPTASAYASGVRLFAFKSKKGELTCPELKRGLNEAGNANKVLRGANAQGLTPAQVSRGKMLAAEVARDLKREHRRRCRKKA